MNLSAPFILRPVMTTLLMISLLILGIAGYRAMPVSNLPNVNFPTITVTVPFPGVNPETMANTVATPLEKQFMTIPGIKYVTSNNTLGSTTIVLTFEITKNIDLAAVDVDSAIVAAIPQLPPNLPQQPTYKKVNPSSTPIVYIAVTSPTMTQGELYDYANTFIGQRISIIDGVAQVMVYGSPSAVRAQIDPGMAATMGITLSDIASVMANANQYLPLGQFDGNQIAATIYDNGALLKAIDYSKLIVSYNDQYNVRINDLGVVLDSLQKDRSSRRYVAPDIDQPSVTLAVQGQPGANAVKIADAIHELLPRLQSQLPGALELFVVFDRSESIRQSVKDVELTLFIAFLLVVLVIFFYLGKVQETLIPSVVMPFSIMGTFAVIHSLGYTIDNLSLLALTLAIGFIIDDAIVVLENISRHHEEGESVIDAALNGSRQICFTIVSMTLSLIAVFIPLLFMPGIIGKLFEEFSVTLTIVTLISGILALTLTPMLCSRLLRQSTEERTAMERFSHYINDRMLRGYKKALHWVLQHRIFMLAAGVLSVLCSAYLFTILPTDFIPNEDIGFIIGYTEAMQGTSSDQMNRYQRELIDILKQEPSIRSIISIGANPEYRQGILFMSLIPQNERKPISSLVQEYNAKLRNVPGVNVYLKNLPLIDLNIGSQVRGAYQYLIQSLDAQALYKGAQALFDKMRSDPMFQGISTDLEIETPQWNLKIDRDLAYSLAIDTETFEQSLLLGYSGNRISRIQTPIDQYDVIVELNRELQRASSSLDLIYLRSTKTNAIVPLNAIASWEEGVGPASVNHFAQFPAVTITFNIDPKVPLSDALERLRQHAADSFDTSVTGNVTGAAQTFEESINGMTILLLITVFTIYIVLGILYESFIHPLTILSTLPPAILGGLLILYITGRPLSLYAYLGIILLIGIVKKNGIMIVDFALDNIRNRGETAENSIFEACVVRFRPIMMTTVAAVMGAVPIALGIGAGAESRRPLGLVIIGGMCISQLITLFLTPVIYLYLEQLREWWSSNKAESR